MLAPPVFHFDPDLVFGRFDALKRPPLVLKCREIESIVLKKGQKGSFFVFFRVFWVFSCFFVLECRGRLFWLDFSTIIWRDQSVKKGYFSYFFLDFYFFLGYGECVALIAWYATVGLLWVLDGVFIHLMRSY